MLFLFIPWWCPVCIWMDKAKCFMMLHGIFRHFHIFSLVNSDSTVPALPTMEIFNAQKLPWSSRISCGNGEQNVCSRNIEKVPEKSVVPKKCT